MGKYIKLFISSLYAGVAISIGCIAFLCTKQAIFFPIGLLIVCGYQFNLFTGKIPYAEAKEVPKLLFIFIGNIIGAMLIGTVFRYAKPTLSIEAIKICETKLSEGWNIIPLAIMCNVLIFTAVDVFNDIDFNIIFRTFVLWMATTIFVICGFEHCVANSFYFALAGMIDINSAIFILNNMVWNAVGGLLIYRSLVFVVEEK